MLRVIRAAVAATETVRLGELAASLSLATDIGLGVALENGQRAALMTVALAEAAGVGADEARDAFYVALLKVVGCTGDEDFGARVFGEDSGNWIAHMGGAFTGEMLRAMVGNIGRKEAFPRRLSKVLRAFGKLPGMPANTRGHCEVGRLLAERLGLSARVSNAMTQVFERWDGKGEPRKLKGEAIERAVRLVQLAADAQAARRLFGTDETVALVRTRAGHGYDPKLVEVFCRYAPKLFAALEVPSVHDAVLAAEPGEPVRLSGEALETAIATIGQYADIKSRFTRGHSAGVAALAGRAAERQGLAEANAVRRAGHLHDIGRAGVVLDIWDKPGALTESERERARMHSYFTERVLARLDSLAPAPAIAALAHERLDGGGYHRRLPAAGVSMGARILAAADVYHAMTEARPHRAALQPARAADEVRAEARAGRLDRDAVEAVLAAAGQPTEPVRRTHPAGLTDRELEVVRLLARGLTNKEIATALDISAKTAGHHVQHIFEKAGVTTRAAATLFAMQNALIAL
jgi:HD-GYP domain-containing protein (c-di-GMP phosphodiesterase class II)